MTVSLSIPAVRLRRRLTALLWLLALVLATGVSLSMTHQHGARLAEVDDVVLPSLRLVHEMTVVVDEARGLSALHLLRADPAEQRALEDRMQAARQRIERRMAVSRQRLADDTERRHFQQVRASLTAYWAAQARLLSASRQAAHTPPAAAQARALLVGDSQAAFQQLRADLEAWWAYTDELASMALAQAASQARQQQLLLGLQALLALALGACLLVGRPLRRAGAQAPVAPWPPTLAPTPAPTLVSTLAPALVPALVPATSTMATPPLPHGAADLPLAALDSLALQARLLALNAAVVAARGGAVGPSATLAEEDVRRLAAQLGATAARLSALAAGLPALADAGDPGHLADAGDPGHLADAGDPGHPADAGDPGHPADAGDPGHPADAGDPGHPADAGDPGHPADAGDRR